MDQMVLAQLKKSKFVRLDKKGEPIDKLSNPKSYDEVKDTDDIGLLIDQNYVVLDFDSLDHFTTAVKIVEHTKLNTRIMKSDRGGHIWFKSDTPLKNNVNINTPLTLHVDIRSFGKLSYVKIKRSGTWREWTKFDESVDYIPDYFMPIKHSTELFRMKSSDGRNSALFSYIITLTTNGMSRDSIKETFNLINEFIFEDKLNQNELDTILRDDAFSNLRPAFFDKNTFLHNIFGNYLMSNHDIYSYHGRLYMYNDGWYTQDSSIIESKMIEYIPTLTQRQRKEVLSYMILVADPLPPVNPYIITCENGAVDIRTGTIKPHSPENFSRNKIPTVFDPSAYDETVDKTLDKIASYDPQIRKLIEEMIGYSLIPIAKFQKAIILYGSGANGKSTLFDMIIELIGDINISSLSIQELNHNFKLSEITNKLVNIGDDVSDMYIEDSSIFKKLVTGDEVTVDKKHEQPFKLKNYATLMFSMNNLPQFKDKSDGLMRRLIIVPLENKFSITDPDYDPFILDKLTSRIAKSYLLNIAIEGVVRLFAQNKFTDSDRVEQILNDYQLENNNVLAFLEDNTIEDTSTQDVYNNYVWWCAQTGVSQYKIRKFNSEIRKHSGYDTKNARINGKTQQIWTIEKP